MLQSLILDSGSLAFIRSDIDINECLKRHPNLIELEMPRGRCIELSLIAKCCPMLRKLTMWRWKNKYMAAISALDKLTTLKFLSGGDNIRELLQTSKSSQTLEEFVILDYLGDGRELVDAISRFANLKQLSFVFQPGCFDDGLVSQIHRLVKLRVLSFGGNYFSFSLTTEGLVNLVRHLPDLEQLSLRLTLLQLQLKESTYFRIGEICRARNQKLLIKNFHGTKTDAWVGGMKRKEPYAGQHEFIQFVTMEFDVCIQNIQI